MQGDKPDPTTTKTTTTTTTTPASYGIGRPAITRPYFLGDDVVDYKIRKEYYQNYTQMLLRSKDTPFQHDPSNPEITLRCESWSYKQPENAFGHFENGGGGVCIDAQFYVKLDSMHKNREEEVTGVQQRIFDGFVLHETGPPVPVTMRFFRFDQFDKPPAKMESDHGILCLTALECEKYMRTLAFVDKLTEGFNAFLAELGVENDIKLRTTHKQCNLIKFLHASVEQCAVVEKNIKLDDYDENEYKGQTELRKYSADNTDGRCLLVARNRKLSKATMIRDALEAFSHYSLLVTGYLAVVTGLFGVFDTKKREFVITSPKVPVCVCFCVFVFVCYLFYRWEAVCIQVIVILNIFFNSFV